MQNAEVVGPSRIESFFGKTFAACYRLPFGVHVWCPDFLTSYIIQVPKTQSLDQVRTRVKTGVGLYSREDSSILSTSKEKHQGN